MHRLPLGLCLLLLIGTLVCGLYELFFINLALVIIQLIPIIVRAIQDNKYEKEHHETYLNGEWTDLSEYIMPVDIIADEDSSITSDDNSLGEKLDDEYFVKVNISYEDRNMMLEQLDVILESLVGDRVVIDFKNSLLNDQMLNVDLLSIGRHLVDFIKSMSPFVFENMDKKFIDTLFAFLNIIKKYIRGSIGEEGI